MPNPIRATDRSWQVKVPTDQNKSRQATVNFPDSHYGTREDSYRAAKAFADSLPPSCYGNGYRTRSAPNRSGTIGLRFDAKKRRIVAYYGSPQVFARFNIDTAGVERAFLEAYDWRHRNLGHEYTQEQADRALSLFLEAYASEI